MVRASPCCPTLELPMRACLSRLALTLCTLSLSAAALAAATPEQAASEYLAALQRKDTETMAASLHPDELNGMQQVLLSILEQESRSKPPHKAMAMFVGPKASMAEARAMPAAKLVGKVLAVRLAMSEVDSSQILGSVPEKDQAHVLARVNSRALGMEQSTLTVISTRRDGDGWKLLLNGQIESLRRMLQLFGGGDDKK